MLDVIVTEPLFRLVSEEFVDEVPYFTVKVRRKSESSFEDVAKHLGALIILILERSIASIQLVDDAA